MLQVLPLELLLAIQAKRRAIPPINFRGQGGVPKRGLKRSRLVLIGTERTVHKHRCFKGGVERIKFADVQLGTHINHPKRKYP